MRTQLHRSITVDSIHTLTIVVINQNIKSNKKHVKNMHNQFILTPFNGAGIVGRALASVMAACDLVALLDSTSLYGRALANYRALHTPSGDYRRPFHHTTMEVGCHTLAESAVSSGLHFIVRSHFLPFQTRPFRPLDEGNE